MANSIPKAVIEWLLEDNNPSLRYFTLIHLLNKPPENDETGEAFQRIMETGIIPRILEKQHPEGYWGQPEKFYTDKYRGTVWNLMLLAELGAHGNHSAVQNAAEFILNHSRDHESSAYAYREPARGDGGQHSEVIPCLTGNMLWSLIRLGWLRDARVQEGIDWICRYQRADDGETRAPSGWPYDRYKMCWGSHSCHMGVVKSLKALAAIPEQARNQAVNDKIAELSEYMLVHHIFRKSHDLTKVSRPGWKKFGFPLMYQTDILEITEILTDLGYQDPRMEDALELIRKKRSPEGKWLLENSYNDRLLCRIEMKGKESKWITFKAWKVLQSHQK